MVWQYPPPEKSRITLSIRCQNNAFYAKGLCKPQFSVFQFFKCLVGLLHLLLLFQLLRAGWWGEYSFRCQPVDYSTSPKALLVINDFIFLQDSLCRPILNLRSNILLNTLKLKVDWLLWLIHEKESIKMILWQASRNIRYRMKKMLSFFARKKLFWEFPLQIHQNIFFYRCYIVVGSTTSLNSQSSSTRWDFSFYSFNWRYEWWLS